MKRFFVICLVLVLMFSFTTVAFADYTIEITIDPEGGGTVEGGGTHKAGKNATLIATPSTGFTFDGWYKGSEKEPFSKDVKFVFEGEADRSYTAKFTPAITLSVNSDNEQGGTVTQSGTGNYQPNETVTLTAISSNGYKFSGWFDVASPATALNTDNSYSFSIQESRNIIGKFTPSFELDVAAVPIEGGTVTGSGTYEGGKIAEITAVAQNGYQFAGWYPPDNLTGDPISKDTEFKLAMDTNVSLSAKFEKSVSNIAIKIIVIAAIGILVAVMAFYFVKKKNTTPKSRPRRNPSRRV